MPIDSLMVSAVVLEDEVCDCLVEFKSIFRWIVVNVFALDHSPESFIEGIIRSSTFAIISNFNSLALQGAYPKLAGILST